MHTAMDALRDLLGPGLIFLVLFVWLVRKAVKAARTESDLEGERLAGALAEELQRGRENARAAQRPALQAVPPEAGSSAAGRALESAKAPGAPREPRPALEDASRFLLSPEAPSRRAALALAPEVPSRASPEVPLPLAGADVAGVSSAHLALVAALVEEREAALLALTPATRRRLEVLWVRATAGHVAWCERRHPAIAEATLVREVICVARLQDGAAGERWTFG